MSFSSLESDPLVTLVFRGQSRAVSLDHFSTYSTDSDPPTHIEIDSSVSTEAFDQFATACQGGNITITRETAADLSRLFSKWRMPDLARAIERWIGSHTDDMMIPVVLAALAEGSDCSAELTGISDNLTRFLDDPLLIKLPLPVLGRVLNIEGHRGAVRQIFTFLLKALDEIGPAASVLFAGLDFAGLKAEDLLELLDRPSFIWEFVAEAVGDASKAAKAAVLAEDQRIDQALAGLPA
jgi:hypothetical protein